MGNLPKLHENLQGGLSVVEDQPNQASKGIGSVAELKSFVQ